jgi:tetratricopeptide (TPR) repeat protein
MTDVTRHLGEIMGQSEAERQAAADSARAAAERAAANPPAQSTDAAALPASPDSAADGISAATGSPVDAVAGGAADHAASAAHAAGHAANHGADLAAYAFPFKASEIFGLLPDSVGGKVESLWNFAHKFSGETNALTMGLTGLVILAILITIVSTFRVWRRGQEVSVAGFGDHLTRPGTRYTVRQDAPVRAKEAKASPIANPAAQIPQASGDIVAAPKAPGTEQLTVPAMPAPPNAKAPAPSAETKPAAKLAAPAKLASTVGARGAFRAAKPAQRGFLARMAGAPAKSTEKPAKAQLPLTSGKTGAAPPVKTEASTHAPAAAPPEEKKPKTVRRQLFKRAATTHTFTGQLQGAYGSYEARDRLFAGNYLKETNEAFEAAHLKGKGPRLSGLRLSDSRRAERLFMMATRTAPEDPPTALAALWQAVEEDSADAVAWLRLAHCYLELGDTGRAARILEPLQGEADRAGLWVIVAAAANSRGKIAAQKGDADAARKLFAGALTAAQASDNPFLIGISAANLGLAQAAKGRLEPAREHLALGIKRLDSCAERSAAAHTRMALGTVLRGLGDSEGAEQSWTQAADGLRSCRLDEEAAIVERWLKGEAPPAKITL